VWRRVGLPDWAPSNVGPYHTKQDDRSESKAQAIEYARANLQELAMLGSGLQLDPPECLGECWWGPGTIVPVLPAEWGLTIALFDVERRLPHQFSCIGVGRAGGWCGVAKPQASADRRC
jgi:hypothetical protein